MRFESLEEKVVLATYAVIGDYGNSGAGEQAVADMVKGWNPEHILTLGDNNYEVGSAATIDANIGQYFHDYIGNYQGSYGAGASSNRFFPTLGNHDWQTPAAQPYLDYFTLPGNERYYDFVLDNVHFFALDSDSQEPDGITSGSVQAQWLRDGLANSQEMFNVVYFHHAPYVSGSPTYAMRWPFKEWGADAVLAGHQHQYERLNVGDLPYFVNGLGGAEIVPVGSPSDGSQVRYNGDFGAMRLTTGSTTLQFEFLSIGGGGTLIDSFTIDADGGNSSNDNFANAAPLTGTSINTSSNNYGATFETSEPYNVGSSGGKSVWWNWTAPATGTVTVATAASDFDTTLGVYTGTTVGNLTKVAANDDVSGSVRTSRLTFAATANQTYRISVDGYGGATGDIALQLQFAESPPLSGSDAFSSRTVLVGENVTAAGTNTSATLEAGEPRNAGVTGGKSVWWSWTAPNSTSVSINTSGSSFDTTLGVYTGSNVNALLAIASNDDEKGSVSTSLVTFNAVAGTSYQISVDGYRGASGQISFTINAASPAGTTNDSFANATPLTGNSVNTSGNNLAATFETSEPYNVGSSGGKSVWWTWTAPATGTVTVATAASNFDTTLGVYTGTTVGNLTKVATNDDVSGSVHTSQVTFAATANQTYRISVDGYGGATGNIALQLQFTEAPPVSGSNAFSSRSVLVGENVTAAGNNTSATLESGEPRNAGVTGGKSVWWSWTAPSSGSFSISTSGSSFDTTLGVYTGSSVNSLVAVASNDDERGSISTSRVTFNAVAGTAYQISVDGYRGASGQISLSIMSNHVPNDNFANRVALSGASLTVTGSNLGASLETGEPKNGDVTGGSSVWWSWTAPAAGPVSFTTAGSNFDTILGVYVGSSLTTLTPVASNDDEARSILTSRLTFTAIAGRVYHISVDGYRGASGQISLTINTGDNL